MYNQSKVQKKSKKSKLNGFMLFAIEFNKKTVTSGKEAFVKQREIAQASPHWKNLSHSKQLEYKERAKQLNSKIINTYERYNCLGEKISEVDERLKQQEEAKQNRHREIEQMLRDAADLAQFDTHVFHLVATSKFYDDSDQIYPAEFAMAKFSLAEGIIDTMQLRINPGPLPIGSAYDALEISRTTHKYDMDRYESEGESSYLKILEKILRFVNEEIFDPVFFTEGNEDFVTDSTALRDTQKIMRLIFEKAGEYQISDELKVYSIDELLFFLKKISVELKHGEEDVPFSSILDANQSFKKVKNEFVFKARSCDYHMRMDVLQHCCLSKVRCYGYTLAKWCARGDKYALKPGHHFPENFIADINDDQLNIYD